MMNLLKQNEDNRKSSLGQLIVGGILGILALVLLFSSMSGTRPDMLAVFLDIPSLLGVVLICTSIVLLSGARGKKEIFEIGQKAVIPAGVFISVIAIVVILRMLEDPATIGPNLAVAVLSIFYSVLIYLVLIPVNKRLEK